MISIRVNGEELNLEKPISLIGFLDSQNINTQFIAVAYNHEVIAKEDYDSVMLDNGDSLEIVKPVGGG
ncbi:MAG: thiamine biosynthesis protein ThiS [Chloroflexi bacterium]|nr:thiamine biosynthesis protein ThiS [Chloroflexota bacterium]|tara:strand:+ start:1860 stop:2063 length:204 start_codon:yes stop_codon:yes gene_type:complete